MDLTNGFADVNWLCGSEKPNRVMISGSHGGTDLRFTELRSIGKLQALAE